MNQSSNFIYCQDPSRALKLSLDGQDVIRWERTKSAMVDVNKVTDNTKILIATAKAEGVVPRIRTDFSVG